MVPRLGTGAKSDRLPRYMSDKMCSRSQIGGGGLDVCLYKTRYRNVSTKFVSFIDVPHLYCLQVILGTSFSISVFVTGHMRSGRNFPLRCHTGSQTRLFQHRGYWVRGCCPRLFL